VVGDPTTEKEESMKRMTAAVVAVSAVLMVFALTSVSPAQTGAAAKGAGSAMASLRADASCHDPCDDPFWLKARVKDANGKGMGGVKVRFSFRLESGQVSGHGHTNAAGYVHLHVKLTPSTAPGGVRVKVTARATHDGVSRTATTWFTPNYN
jgi:hypothetical protein